LAASPRRSKISATPTLKRANLTWTPENLREYLINPQAKVKGNRMPN
jgi:cytochrome c2